ncbi:MAG TPA: hypothetical protein VFL82_13320 [Thermomicrobiales bacterium]|nr:hypothetical protein [Thermomicrobiales bacterium]
MEQRFVRHLVRPLVVFVIAAALVALFIVTIGETVLHLYVHGTPDYKRWDLGVAIVWSLAILGIAAFFNSRPHSNGPLDSPVALGHQSMFSAPEEAEAKTEQLRRGPLGTIDDIQRGYTLYARSGAFGRVNGMIPGSEEHGVTYKGYIYANGVSGVSDEMWIPVEAVTAVYPESHSVFLAIKGDETLTFGWNKPPAHFSREPRPPSAPKAL